MSMRYIISFIFSVCLVGYFFSHQHQEGGKTLVVATCADYPPFEYYSGGALQGFDIALAKIIAQELQKDVQFKDMSFSSLFPSLQNGLADMAISTITVTEERRSYFDFSRPYYLESLAIISNKNDVLLTEADLKGKKIACQLGTTMEIWLKNHALETSIMAMDANPSAVEALKAGHVDGVLIDAVQAAAFVGQNQDLHYEVIATADSGYAIAFKKGAPLLEPVNAILEDLEQRGTLQLLKEQYIGASHNA